MTQIAAVSVAVVVVVVVQVEALDCSYETCRIEKLPTAGRAAVNGSALDLL